MIFCKSLNFLQETEETLKSHVSFVNSIFGVELKRVNNVFNMVWFVAKKHTEILYMVGHTGDALGIINQLHILCEYGFGTHIRDVYLNTCTSKPDNKISRAGSANTSSIILPSEISDDEKKKLGIPKNEFVTLDNAFEKIKDDGFRIHLCQQITVTDENVKMARFLPMDECGLGFSPTSSELLLYNQRGNLAEKLSAAFEEINE